jgi:hypothetical protein
MSAVSPTFRQLTFEVYRGSITKCHYTASDGYYGMEAVTTDVNDTSVTISAAVGTLVFV